MKATSLGYFGWKRRNVFNAPFVEQRKKKKKQSRRELKARLRKTKAASVAHVPKAWEQLLMTNYMLDSL